MPSPAKLSVVALVVAAIAACSGPAATPSMAPSPTAIPAPTLTPTVAPSPSPIETTEPTFACPSDPSALDVSVIVRGGGSLRVELGADPLPPPEVVDSTIVPIEGTAIGGIDLSVGLTADEGAVDPIGITTITAEFLPFGSASPLLIPTAVEDGGASLRFPDLDVEGQVRFTIEWTSPCGDGQGSGSLGLAVVNSSLANCPPTEDGLIESLSKLGNSRVSVAGLSVPLGIVGWSGRWIVANGVDDVPRLGPFDRNDPIAPVAPGASIVIRESIDDLDLLSVRAAFFTRADVLDHVDGEEIDAVDVLRRTAGPKGRIGIPAPLDAGSYVIELQGQSQTSCLSLDTYEVVSVEVR